MASPRVKEISMKKYLFSFAVLSLMSFSSLRADEAGSSLAQNKTPNLERKDKNYKSPQQNLAELFNAEARKKDSPISALLKDLKDKNPDYTIDDQVRAEDVILLEI